MDLDGSGVVVADVFSDDGLFANDGIRVEAAVLLVLLEPPCQGAQQRQGKAGRDDEDDDLPGELRSEAVGDQSAQGAGGEGDGSEVEGHNFDQHSEDEDRQPDCGHVHLSTSLSV